MGSRFRPPLGFKPQDSRADTPGTLRPPGRSVARVLTCVSQQSHPTRKDVDRADHIGVSLETTLHTSELGLRLPVVRTDMADRCGWCPAAERQPALVEEGLVQARLGPNVASRHIGCACRQLGLFSSLQVLNTHHRVVFADRGRELLQQVAAPIGDAGMSL
ncbi:hypothetical protein CTKA_02081 [Chthonomonas calidirosea]|uniref:Uncharacterized protein n=1 Tax=Chthonomonas calidirosea (strain DSM 23976 / ICMP 18418 / T49) TaxID=1303518 RepID=S0EVJ7_CHTCT|nr:hypothetical protein CCALI_02014 [Chthonomonas calidirosea T49]CEK18122.1 hypothetical protein CP488_02075 [Chthonomonas calidirosea]CEK19146.1 hypothetical protein CTKA_02081 [Chthonomonas calidirosea]